MKAMKYLKFLWAAISSAVNVSMADGAASLQPSASVATTSPSSSPFSSLTGGRACETKVSRKASSRAASSISAVSAESFSATVIMFGGTTRLS